MSTPGFWYSESLAESHRLGTLPVYESAYDFPYASSWEIGSGNNVASPATANSDKAWVPGRTLKDSRRSHARRRSGAVYRSVNAERREPRRYREAHRIHRPARRRLP